jgi:nuclear pore complex protein Nup205
VMPLEAVQVYVAERIYMSTVGSKRQPLLPLILPAMSNMKAWLQKLGDKVTAAQTLGQAGPGGLSEEAETIEYTRVSLIQEHELLGVILCRLVTKRQATVKDFEDFLAHLRKLDRYDHLLVHLIPATGAYLSMFGSAVGGHDLIQARALNNKLFPATDELPWALPYLQATVRAWWLAEYSGFYLEGAPESAIPPNTDLDEEDRQRAKQFQDSVKEGAFDFLLSVAGDVKSPDWHDPVRLGMHRWLQRKSPSLVADSVQFADFFQSILVTQLQVFVDMFITNLPDVLRKLRVEEDEQRQLSQIHEQDLDLERFLLIIAYAYESRYDAQGDFWEDSEGHLHGFLLWASKRASTPLVTAFCELLQAISGTEQWATCAHKFLLDEGHHSTGKMRRAQTLTWNQIFKELNFFLDKAKQKPAPVQTVRYRGGKPSHDIVETEPESAMMLESYLRLTTKLATESETARQYLLLNGSFNLVETILELTSTPIPPRLRGCSFMALKALLTRKTQQESHIMWHCLDTWITGGFVCSTAGNPRPPPSSPISSMERTFDEISRGFDDPVAFVQLLLALVAPAADSSALNDALPFPENLGSTFRVPGIEPYVDYVIGLVFASKTNDLTDIHQIRVLRLGCLDFIMTCLATFNEDLIVMANETNIMIDSIISTTDLATYVRIHPFARVMEWMLNDKVMAALFNTIHQEVTDVGNVAPDSPLVLGILRAVEVITKVLDLQATYTNLVRPIIRKQSSQLQQPLAKASFASFEDGLETRLSLVVDLGNYVSVGHSDLTLACLKLLEKMSSSSKIAATWSGSNRHSHRNKAIVAMEANGEHESISRAFAAELATPLDVGREAESPAYKTKFHILNFLLKCLLETPNKPTIAHLILGFKCGTDSITIESNGAFDSRTSVFHGLLKLLMETPSGDTSGMRYWLLALKARSMYILRVLWSSQLSSSIVIGELRENEFLFHLLVREAVITPALAWEGQSMEGIAFPMTDGSLTLVDFLVLRRMTLEYIAMELCMISQGRMPSVKRRIFDALNGQVLGDNGEPVKTPTVFDLYDFQFSEGVWHIDLPPLKHFRDLDLSVCLETDPEGNMIYNIDRVQEILLLKQGEFKYAGVVATADDLASIATEETIILEYLISTNRQKQLLKQSHLVLTTWVKLLLVMVECNDFEGTIQTSLYMQALQAILPSLETFAVDRPDEALELSKLAKVLLFKLHQATASALDKDSQAIGNLISDRLYQVFQICLRAIGKWAGTTELRSVYYEICYRYLMHLGQAGQPGQGRSKTLQTIQAHGERLINVICDDAYGAEPSGQVASLMMLGILVNIDHQQGETHIVETLNRLNFIGILVDSLRNIMQEWHDVFAAGHTDQENFQKARLALLLQLAQTRAGAKHILHANLLRTVETSGLFSADPELQTRTDNPRALEHHYDLLAKVARVIGAALVSRGSHNVVQGRRFLTENRMLVSHTLKRSSGIGAAGANEELEEKVDDLAEGLMIIITATGFLEVSTQQLKEKSFIMGKQANIFSVRGRSGSRAKEAKWNSLPLRILG